MLGIVKAKMKIIAHISIFSVSKYAPIPKPMFDYWSCFTESEIRVLFEEEVRLGHFHVHLPEEGLLEGHSEVGLVLFETASAVVEIRQRLDQRDARKRVVLVDGQLAVVDLAVRKGGVPAWCSTAQDLSCPGACSDLRVANSFKEISLFN
jgi:hypothetical protein